MDNIMRYVHVDGPYHHVHLDIFLQLDPKSLKSARQVSRAWSQFIKSQLWMNMKGRKRLEERLAKQWRLSQPSRR